MPNGFDIAINLHLLRLDLKRKIVVQPVDDDFLKIEMLDVTTDDPRVSSWTSIWKSLDLCEVLETVPQGVITDDNLKVLIANLYRRSYNPFVRAVYLNGVKMNARARRAR